MKLLLPLVIVGAGLAACNLDATGDDAQSRARDVAMVEAAQRTKPPAVPLSPQPVSFAELDVPGSPLRLPSEMRKPTAGEGCGFVPAGEASNAPVFVAGPALGLLKLRGVVSMLAADSGSARLKGGLRRTYASGANFLELTEGEALTAPGGRKASLTIRDPYDRIVYFSAGELRCGTAGGNSRTSSAH